MKKWRVEYEIRCGKEVIESGWVEKMAETQATASKKTIQDMMRVTDGRINVISVEPAEETDA